MWNPSKTPVSVPTEVHGTMDAAINEATRLAVKEKQPVYVLTTLKKIKPVGTAKVDMASVVKVLEDCVIKLSKIGITMKSSMQSESQT